MKIRRARFTNFRLLRNVELEFSTATDRRLTVIRAENETGKTTVLTGLQWALFGDEGLPGRDVRLHPINWDEDEVPTVEVVAEIEFEQTFEREGRDGETLSSDRSYWVRRTQMDRILSEGGWETVGTSFMMFERRPTGDTEVPNPEIVLEQMMSSSVKDLFFTDGDRALNFITSELPDSEKRSLVRKAIRDMLGFEILEQAAKHLGQAASAIRRDTAKLSGDKSVTDAEQTLSQYEKMIEKTKDELGLLETELSTLSGQITQIKVRIDTALAKGDREQLARERKEMERAIENTREQMRAAETSHSDLFKRDSEALAVSLIGRQLQLASRLINEQHQKGRIPRTSIPVLEDRLKLGECICGQPLRPGLPQYDHIKELIRKETDTREADARLTSLRFVVDKYTERLRLDPTLWETRLNEIARQRDAIEKAIDELGVRKADLERRLDEIPETDVQELRTHLSSLERTRTELVEKRGAAQERIKILESNKQKAEDEYKRLTKRSNQLSRLRAEEQAAEDVLQVIRTSYAAIEQETIPVVSSEMNAFFLRMINADPEQNAIIREAEVSPSYEIKVYGPEGRELHPDRDLNGASRRALTLAFILALTRVSGVVAPLVVDTPLGMMSGEVKRLVLEVLVENAEQPVLLLTRSEINGIEDILDRAAGVFNTLTNTAHYPGTVVNDVFGPPPRVVDCSCSHRGFCKICERKGDRTLGALREQSTSTAAD